MKMTDDQILDVIENLDARRLHEEPHEEKKMDIIDRLHQKLEKMDLSPTESHNVKILIKQALAAGLSCNIPTDPLEGYSNLTAAISAKEPIDYEKLDGLNVKCVNPELRGELHGTLKRDDEISAEHCGAWWNGRMDECYTTALWSGWNDKHGWTLWVKGEIPLHRKTADELKVGTYFYGEAPSGEPDLMYVGGCSESSKTIYHAPEMLKSSTPATRWVVLEEYGPFQKPEEK